MMQMAQEVTVAADASKISRRSLSSIGNISRADRLITDSRIESEVAERIRQSDVEVFNCISLRIEGYKVLTPLSRDAIVLAEIMEGGIGEGA